MSLRTPAFFNKSLALEIFLLAIILCVAAWLRFENLTLMPDGFHGDEAISGMEGQRILREGSIGPYSPLALGQPSGPLYLTALSVRYFGATVWAVRAVSALLGTLTVAVLFFMLRRHVEGSPNRKRVVALLGTAFLAILDWHIHFSRIGFPVIAWPLCTLLAVWAALEAVQRDQARWWVLTGLLLGVGVYSYSAHIICMLAMWLWLLFYLSGRREVALSRRATWLLSLGVASLLAMLPMLMYVFTPSNDYFAHARLVSVFSAPSLHWSELNNWGSKIGFLVGRYFDFWNDLSWNSWVDSGDGTGVVPVVPLSMLVVALSGLVLAWKKRGPLLEISAFFVLIMPLAPTLTLEGNDRRALPLAPFLALLTAIGIVEIFRLIESRTRTQTSEIQPRNLSSQLPFAAKVGGLTLLCCVLVFQNLNGYFNQTMPSEPISWTFGQEMTATCRYLNSLPADAHVYFYCDRWGSQYETRRFLAPNISIEDRSRQFGTFSFAVDRAAGSPYLVLIGNYQLRLPQLQKMYPHNHIDKGPPRVNGKPTFIAFHPL